MNMLRQLKSGASQFLDSLEEGWSKLVSKSGQALTRFTRRAENRADGPDESGVIESYGMLAGEVAETTTHLIVRLEAPGMEKDDFDITVVNGALSIRGEKRFERERTEADYHIFESAYGAFERSLPLPTEVDIDRAEAMYERGVLTVKLPKSVSRDTRRIKVG